MKEFDYRLTEIFKGISPARVNRKQQPSLLKCHNLEPVDDDYVLHDVITDMNATGETWGGLGVRRDDVFVDHDDSDFVDHEDDIFKDD